MSVVCFQDTVSVHRPRFYAERFEKFMCLRVFKKMPRKSDLQSEPGRPDARSPRRPVTLFCFESSEELPV